MIGHSLPRRLAQARRACESHFVATAVIAPQRQQGYWPMGHGVPRLVPFALTFP